MSHACRWVSFCPYDLTRFYWSRYYVTWFGWNLLKDFWLFDVWRSYWYDWRCLRMFLSLNFFALQWFVMDFGLI
jgi:hypothetical protein